jgi:DNA-directed RNA polymerase sigma subunit (sigma70/sigma32)
MHPGVELWEMSETCALRYAERPTEDDEVTADVEHTLEAVGRALNITQEMVRLGEMSALRKVRRLTGIKEGIK